MASAETSSTFSDFSSPSVMLLVALPSAKRVSRVTSRPCTVPSSDSDCGCHVPS